MRNLPEVLKKLAKVGVDWKLGFPIFKVLDVATEKSPEPDVKAPTTNVNQRVDSDTARKPYAPRSYHNFLTFAGNHVGHSTASKVWDQYGDPDVFLQRVKNHLLSESDKPTLPNEAVFDAVYLLHVMKFLGDFDPIFIGWIRKAVKGKRPDLQPIVLERICDLHVRSGGEDRLLEREDLGERFKRAGDTHGFVHNGLWKCAVIHAQRGNFDEAEKLLDDADEMLERGVCTNALFVRPPMDTYKDKIANCMRLRAMVEAGKEVYKGTRNFRPAKNFLLKALHIHGEIRQEHGVANDLRDFAKVYMEERDFNNASVCINRARLKYKKVRDLYMAEDCSNILKLDLSNARPVSVRPKRS